MNTVSPTLSHALTQAHTHTPFILRLSVLLQSFIDPPAEECVCVSEQIAGTTGLSQQSHTPVSITVIFMDQVGSTAGSALCCTELILVHQ